MSELKRYVVYLLLVGLISLGVVSCASFDAVPGRNPEALMSLPGFLLGECSDDIERRGCIIDLGAGQTNIVALPEHRTIDLSLSPDQKLIVFAQVLPEKALWLTDKNGTTVELLVRGGDELLRFPTWSYDGTKIAYLRSTDPIVFVDSEIPAYQHTILEVIDVNTTTAQILTPPTGEVLDFSWSPSGEQILISARIEDHNQDGSIDQLDPARLYLVTLADQSLHPVANYISPGLALMKPAWSSNGDYISFIVRMTELIILSAPEGREVARLEIGTNGDYKWSVTGSRLAYVGNTVPSLDKQYDNVFIFDVATQITTQLTDTESYTTYSNFHSYGIRLRDPVWSPDEKYIAFVWQWMGDDYLVVASVDGAHLTRVAESLPGYRLSSWGQ